MRHTFAFSLIIVSILGGAAAAGPTWTYNLSNTNSAQATNTLKQQVWLKGGVPVLITTCGTLTSGDTYLRLRNTANSADLAVNDDGGGCGYGSTISYTPSSDGTYWLWAGCYANTTCAATVRVHLPMRLDVAWSGDTGTTTLVAVHGHGNCTAPSGTQYDARCGNSATGYWLNSTDDGGDGYDMLDDSTAKLQPDGTTWKFSEAISLRWEGTDQAHAFAANDVAYCLVDLKNGTNWSGCNSGLLHRTSFHAMGHSQGAAILDRIFSSGWWPSLTDPSTGAIVGYVASDAGPLAGAKSASALYGTDGAGNFCTTLVSWLVGWAIKDTGNATLTRGAVIGEANNGLAGKSGRWFYKVTTSGGGGSCNNNSSHSVNESVNDTKMGLLCGCIGTTTDDDADGILWNYDSDPTSSPSTSNGGKTRSQYTGKYWHWVTSWANHSHNRNDAYVAGYGVQTLTTCNSWGPGTCIGQFIW